MGCFSWMKAQLSESDNVKNVADGMPYKFLIPKEFGGGYIVDIAYENYGVLTLRFDLGTPLSLQWDMYELLAIWNRTENEQVLQGIRKGYFNSINYMKPTDEHTDKNRSIGIDIGCYDEDILKLKYPLKLVSADLDITYEECKLPSLSDPNQGCFMCDEEEEYEDDYEN